MARTKAGVLKNIFLGIGVGSLIASSYRLDLGLVALPSLIISCIFQEIENGK